MDVSGNSKIEVVASVIDGDHLVLETVQEKSRIWWPLDRLPSPLPLGSRLTLELHSGADQPGPGNTQADANSEETRRKLLEDLVN